jgi:hypothetical protein
MVFPMSSLVVFCAFRCLLVLVVCDHVLSLLGGVLVSVELYQILFYLNMKRVLHDLKKISETHLPK